MKVYIVIPVDGELEDTFVAKSVEDVKAKCKTHAIEWYDELVNMETEVKLDGDICIVNIRGDDPDGIYAFTDDDGTFYWGIEYYVLARELK